MHKRESFLEQRCALDGKVAAIIGGAGGLGFACAEDLRGAGMRLAIADNDLEALEALPGALGDGPPMFASQLDARDPEALAAFFTQIDEQFGQLDVLVNVVGGSFRAPFAESDPKGWDAIISANFTWLLSSIQLAIPRLRDAGGGSIMSLTSIEGHRAAPNYGVYSAMKAAVTNLTRTLAVELGPDAIRINTIAPDFVPTPRIMRIAFGQGYDEVAAALGDRISIPMGRRGTYGDVGGCALFLASDLSRYVTGTSLHPDGGVTASQGWFNWPESGWINRPSNDVLAALTPTDRTPADAAVHRPST